MYAMAPATSSLSVVETRRSVINPHSKRRKRGSSRMYAITVRLAPDRGTRSRTGLARDYPTIQSVILLFSFVYVAVNLLVDLSYVFFDPRIRY